MSNKHIAQPTKADLLRVARKQQKAYIRECGAREYQSVVQLIEAGKIATWQDLADYGIAR